MKKLLSLSLILVLAVALCFGALAACTTPDESSPAPTDSESPSPSPSLLPDFTFNIVSEGAAIEVTDEDLAALELYVVSYTKNDVTTYFKGVKVSDMVAAVSELPETITGLLFVGEDGYGLDKAALPESHFATAYVTFLSCATEDGTYAALDEENAPARVIDMTADTTFKTIKMLANVYVDGELFRITDGATNYDVTYADLSALTAVDYTYTKDEVVTDYQGYNLYALLAALEISTTGISSVAFTSADGYVTNPALTDAQAGACVLATTIETVADSGEYESLDSSNGPIKALWNNGSSDKNAKVVVIITITRTA
jgi:hypothetical protein